MHRAFYQLGKSGSSILKVIQRGSLGVLEGVLSRYGAPGQVITDMGGEFQGEIGHLLSQHHITPNLASTKNPQADGLAERMVQTN